MKQYRRVLLWILVFSGLTVSSQDSIPYARLALKGDIAFLNDSLFSGTSIEKYEDGKVKSFYSYKEGLPHGVWENYFPEGALESRMFFEEGLAHGKYVELDQEGNVIFNSVFDMGEPLGSEESLQLKDPEFQKAYTDSVDVILKSVDANQQKKTWEGISPGTPEGREENNRIYVNYGTEEIYRLEQHLLLDDFSHRLVYYLKDKEPYFIRESEFSINADGEEELVFEKRYYIKNWKKELMFEQEKGHRIKSSEAIHAYFDYKQVLYVFRRSMRE